MPFIEERLTLYADQVGLVASLRAQPLGAGGLATGPLISTGFTALGGPNYVFREVVPDNTFCVRYELSTAPGVPVVVGDYLNFVLMPERIFTVASYSEALISRLGNPEDLSGPGTDNIAQWLSEVQAKATSADGKLTPQRLTNLDAATPTRLGILDRLAGMMEQVAGLWRWTTNTQSQSPVTPAAPTAEQVAAQIIAQSLFKDTAGLTGLNQVCRDFAYDENGNLTAFRIRVYGTASHAQADNPDEGLVASFVVNHVINAGHITKTTTLKE